jgi:hypothetical protein
LGCFFFLEFVEVPVVQDEAEVVFDFDFVLDFVVFAEGVAHDGDQHVEQMEDEDESREVVKES